MNLKISIITATLNRKDFLPRCIEAVAQQSYPYKEHLIVDGGSTDGTVDLLRSYSQTYPHIRWISEEDNGISNAFNKGLSMVTGDVIGIIGDDDFHEPGAFETVIAEFERNPSIGVVSGNCDHIYNDGTLRFTVKAGFTSHQDLIEFWKNWGRTTYLPPQSTFFRKEVIDKVGGFDEADRYAMDYHHWIKITEHFEVKILDKVLAKFRWDEGTVSFMQVREQEAEACAISKRYWGSKTSRSYYRMAFSYFDYYWWSPLRIRVSSSIKYRTGLFIKRLRRIAL
jgi:glycosyltransferase involved in cell wall biosynthesis